MTFTHWMALAAQICGISGYLLRAKGNVWVAGLQGGPGYTLVQQWSGGLWNDHSPASGTFDEDKDLFWISDSDVWVSSSLGVYHWDGSAWTLSLSNTNQYQYLAGRSTSDVYCCTMTATNTMTYFHWDGSVWDGGTAVTVPFSAIGRAVAVVGGDLRVYGDGPLSIYNVTTATTEYAPSGGGFLTAADMVMLSNTSGYALIDRNNGTNLVVQCTGGTWALAATQPNVHSGGGKVGMDATSTSNVWICGFRLSGGIYRWMVQQWDGTSWTDHVIGVDTTRARNFWAIRVLSSTDVWAVGYIIDPNNVSRQAMWHWDGTWTDTTCSQ